MPTKYIHINGHAVYMHYAGKTTLPEVIPDFSRGRTVVMIHGAGGNGHSWHKQIAHLANAHSPIAIDLPGHGRSSGVDGMNSMREYADFVAAFLDALQINRPSSPAIRWAVRSRCRPRSRIRRASMA